VAPAKGMLSVELAKVEDDWLWHSGMTGRMPGIGFDCYDWLSQKMRRVGWGILLVVGSPLHGVIDFSGCGLMQRLCGILLHFLFCL
jgi:hypothetical protein